MRLLLVLTLFIFSVVVPISGRTDINPTQTVEENGKILGMSYATAAAVTVAVVAGAVVVNSVVGANAGTVLAAVYIGHLVVEVGIVAVAAGGSFLGIGWWADDEQPDSLGGS